jgi:methyltransferase (TIGR00027 family)
LVASLEAGNVSLTALKVATTMITLAAKPGWAERLPEGLATMSEQLILGAKIYPYTPRMLRLARTRWAVRMSDIGERVQPGVFQGLGERKIFMNEQVLAAIAAGARQVLVPGAGFDTLCMRLAPLHPDVHFFELDHPATAAAKKRGIEALGQPSNLTLIPADLGATDIKTVLKACARWDVHLRTVCVAEGLLYYLPRNLVLDLFKSFACLGAPGTRVVFSHLIDLGEHGFARIALRFFGEPWLSASRVDELENYMGANWRVLTTAAGRPRRDLEGFAVAESRPVAR